MRMNHRFNFIERHEFLGDSVETHPIFGGRGVSFVEYHNEPMGIMMWAYDKGCGKRTFEKRLTEHLESIGMKVSIGIIGDDGRFVGRKRW